MTDRESMTDQEMILEQYKIYVEMADRISDRRDKTNKFYTSLLSGLLILLSLTIGRDAFKDYQIVVFTVASVIGTTLNILWFMNIRSYRQLNAGKFKIVHEMEQQLPFPCYDREWEVLGMGEDRRIYVPTTRIEKFVPLLLIIPYVLLFVYSCLMIIKWIAS